MTIGVFLPDALSEAEWLKYSEELCPRASGLRFVYLSGGRGRRIDSLSLKAFVEALACFALPEQQIVEDFFQTEGAHSRLGWMNAFLLDSMGEISALFYFKEGLFSPSIQIENFLRSAEEVLSQKRPGVAFVANRPQSPQLMAMDTLRMRLPFLPSSNPWSGIKTDISVPPLWEQVWLAAEQLRLHGIRPSRSA